MLADGGLCRVQPIRGDRKARGIDDRDERAEEAEVEYRIILFMNDRHSNIRFANAALREAGVRVFAGNDNIRDAWWPYGDADMLGRAMLIAYRSGFFTDSELAIALDMATTEAAAILGREGYGIAPGNEATFVIIDAQNAAAAVAAPPHHRRLVQRGVITAPAMSRLDTVLPSFNHQPGSRA